MSPEFFKLLSESLNMSDFLKDLVESGSYSDKDSIRKIMLFQNALVQYTESVSETRDPG